MNLPTLFNKKRLRVAISISPEGFLHSGHMHILKYGKELAKELGLEFHVRYDNVYASMAKSYKNYPAKKDKWDSGNPHVPVPGAAMWEWIRPEHMTNQQIGNDWDIINNDIKPDYLYLLTDVEEEIRTHFKFHAPWLSYMPIYFTEDLAWEYTYILRGEDWDVDGDHYLWSQMQHCLLKTYRDGHYKEKIIPHLLDGGGEKISKSKKEHTKYKIRPPHKFEELCSKDTFDKFEEKYRNGGWKWKKNTSPSDFGSGAGSSIKETEKYTDELTCLIKDRNIKSCIDIGCGDFTHMKNIYMKFDVYKGIDVSETVIKRNKSLYECSDHTFSLCNLIYDDIDLSQFDLVIIKDCLQHMGNAECAVLLDKIKDIPNHVIVNDSTKNNMKRISSGVAIKSQGVDPSLPPFNYSYTKKIDLPNAKKIYIK